MKKTGFTLAEVLVTLGIIGVVAALTIPALIQNIGDAKIGPKLQKAVATFETATEMMLNQENINSIMAGVSGVAGNDVDGVKLGKKLQNYMKIAYNSSGVPTGTKKYKKYEDGGDYNLTVARFDSDDGMTYYISNTLTKTNPNAARTELENIANNQYLGSVWVDIDGGQQGVNTSAKDLFRFALYNDGTLRPWGMPGYRRDQTVADEKKNLWSESENCDSTGVKDGDTCTGSIFSNGMKIKYD